ncbi:TMEM43 family protein [Rhizobium sp. AQ_MP]|uniref:TMEM43 family protein n=1 Tax=Rhizobium sp. AQ_MP TaxID=2761536 RepID=UPI00163A2DD6|nr:TMEM43 family protein [Rhizobium sp. AQ_MP]MBC2774463.1 TMEM43 family protein [Rhizobium sp. AQ_MP]
MNVVTKTSTSWFSRLGGALTGAVFGFILLLVAIVALFWNEGRSVATYESLVEGQSIVVQADAARIDPALEGKLIHIESAVVPAGDVVDPDTGLSASGVIGLARKVEMYQWVEEKSSKTEKKLGGGEETVTTYTYSKEWSEDALDSSKFQESAGHENPEFWLASTETLVETAKLGAFSVAGSQIASVGARQALPITDETAAQASEALGYPGEGRAVTQALYFGADEKAPQIGDTRIRFEKIVLPDVSIVAMQKGDRLAEYTTGNGYTLFLLAAGRETSDKMFADSQTENVILTWVIRVAGILGLFIGFALIFRIFSVIGDVIPFVGSLIGFGTGLISFVLAIAVGVTVIAIGWFAVRPLLSLGLIAAVAAIVWAYSRYVRKQQAQPAA